MRLKRWESPRRQGRNDKGKGGSARQRQVKKQHKLWSQRLKQNQNDSEGGRSPSFFYRGKIGAKNFCQKPTIPPAAPTPLIRGLNLRTPLFKGGRGDPRRGLGGQGGA